MKVQAKHPLLFLFLSGTALFNILDYFLTMEVIRRGHTEWNPLVNAILHTPYLAFIKVFLIPGTLFVIWHIRFKIGRRLVFYAGFIFTIYLLLMGYFTLILQFGGV